MKAARLYSTSKKSIILYAMGITQHSTGTDNVLSVANLAMLCGKIGKEGCGVNPLRGQNNVQGACDMGAMPDVLPGYQKVNIPENIKKFEAAWGTVLSNKSGLTLPEMMNGAHKGSVKALYIMGENSLVSDPDTKHVRESLTNLDFLVVQDIFLTETAQMADVVLPATSFAEKDGTFTNTERRVQAVRRAIPNVGDSKEDWKIIVELMNRMGYSCSYGSPDNIMAEIASVTPAYGGISYERIKDIGIQWPCPDINHPGTKYMHKDKFTRGKGMFKPAVYKPSAEQPDICYPLTLTTGRILYHYHTMTMTGKSEGLMNIAGENFVEINPFNAGELGIKDGDKVRVSSRRGSIVVKARVSEIVGEGIVFIPFHFADSAANILTGTALDPVTKESELKVCAVKIERV